MRRLSTFLLCVFPLVASAQRIEPIGRMLRRVGPAAPKAPVTATAPAAAGRDSTKSMLTERFADTTHVDTLYTWTLSPGMRAMTNANTYKTEVDFSSSVLIPWLPFTLSATPQGLRTGAQTVGGGAGDLEVDPFTDKALIGTMWSVAGTADYTVSAGIDKSQEYTGSLSFQLWGDTVTSRKIKVGGMALYDRDLTHAGVTVAGFSSAATGSWSLGEHTALGLEYDFKSTFNGEDNTSFKLSQDLPNLPSQPTLSVGFGKHNVFVVSLGVTRVGKVRVAQKP